ncbi:carboxypeptidase-like regulatory domain-containing protein [Flagellimonas meishanensis]|uniref:carboxypeptidase-like regulatory domain-containing protein n=1 Tax=Flagellimonas meishanensis TaxID=2873264 RepID=UPI001CA63A54|nr:carboxypeptidase-like regulatory domain-containing protein [[Muricauda] meishanensis]
MKNFLTLLILFAFVAQAHSQNGTRTVTGTVSDDDEPLTGVSVQVLDKDVKTSSQKDGRYQVPVETGDIIAYTARGMETLKIKVEDVTRVLNVDLSPKVKQLQNVTVTEVDKKAESVMDQVKLRKQKKKILTAFGTLDKSRAGYAIRILDQEDFLPGEYNLVNLLRGRFPNLNFGFAMPFTRGRGRGPQGTPFTGSNNINSVFLRGNVPVVYDIDGQIFTDFPYFLDVQNIERIALIPSLTGTVRYGTLGKGGVIVINTKTASGNWYDENDTYDEMGRLRNNIYDGTALTENDLNQGAPTYLKQLQASTSLSEAKNIYETNMAKYATSPFFTLDAYRYFYESRNENDFADDIIERKYGLFKNNAVHLKALAYMYEAQGRYEKAYEAYKQAFILRPQYAQSYLDLSNSNRNLNKDKRAAVLYSRYFYLLKKGMMETDSAGFSKIINREFNNLLALKKAEMLNKDKIGKIKVDNEDFEGTRLVFEWNDGEAEFDLQFVSPKNQFYTWEHTLAENKATIMQEKEMGYSCAEFLIDDYLPGNWKININYMGNKSLTPTYLKATIYHDYGSKMQRKETKVFKLDIKNVNRELFQLNKTAAVALR